MIYRYTLYLSVLHVRQLHYDNASYLQMLNKQLKLESFENTMMSDDVVG